MISAFGIAIVFKLYKLPVCHLFLCEYLFCLFSLKVKQSHNTLWTRRGVKRYSSYSFITSALDEGEWLGLRPGLALPPGERTPVPIVKEVGWAPEPVWIQRLEEKFFASAGNRI
jgi:hypothetical protein